MVEKTSESSFIIFVHIICLGLYDSERLCARLFRHAAYSAAESPRDPLRVPPARTIAPTKRILQAEKCAIYA